MFFEQQSSNKQKMDGCFFRRILLQNVNCNSIDYVLTQKNAYSQRFILKPEERAWIRRKNITRDF